MSKDNIYNAPNFEIDIDIADVDIADVILQLNASDGYAQANYAVIRACGSDAAIVFGELTNVYRYWRTHGGLTKDGYFYYTIEDMEDKLCMSNHIQDKAIKRLQKYGLVEKKTSGVPAKRYFKLHAEGLIAVCKKFGFQFAKNSKTSFSKIQKLDCENFGTKNIRIKTLDKNTYICENEDVSTEQPEPVEPELVKAEEAKLTKKQILEQQVDEIGEYYNRAVEGTPMPKLRGGKVAKSYRPAIRARIKDDGIDAVKEAIDRAVRSDFLTGKRTGFVASLDWICRPVKFEKILQGDYDNRGKVQQPDAYTQIVMRGGIGNDGTGNKR